MFSPKNSFASGKGGEFAALLSDYGGVRVKLRQLWRIAQCVRGTSGRPVWCEFLGALVSQSSVEGSASERPDVVGKRPVWTAEMAEILADPAAVTLCSPLNIAPPSGDTCSAESHPASPDISFFPRDL